ncbi:MAG TPA: phosphotransferase [Gemmataceae bacterium]|nr:phosphotransferase [Gemmataceae bacterium]
MSTPTLLQAPLGKGYTADVYPWGDGQVLKLFHSGRDRERAEREYRVSRTVHAAGLPVPATYERIEIDGRCGIVFERIDGPSLYEYVQARPWTLVWAVRQLADLHAQIHRVTGPAELPSHRERIARAIDSAADLSEADRNAARRKLAGLPDGPTLCHGDFHPGNVLLAARGPVVIDWGRATRGHPLGDVACTLRLIRTASLPPWSPRPMHWLLACTRPSLQRWYLKRYLRMQAGTRREIEAWQEPLAAAAMGWAPASGAP